MTIKSPFSKSRFENDGSHLYFIKHETLQILEGDTPILITGSRGTGKTTLLNALNWKEQRNNNYLKRVLDHIKNESDYLGVYIKLPELKIKSFGNWEGSNEEIYYLVFSCYLELVWIQELLNAISTLSVDGSISYTAIDEKKCVKNIVNELCGLFNNILNIEQIVTLIDLEDAVKYIRKYIEDSGLQNKNVVDVYEYLQDIGQVGSIGKIFTNHLSPLLTTKNAISLKIKVCMDECECLSLKQNLVVNTLIRLSRYPIFYIFSFVSEPDDSSTTLIDNITNQKADFRKIDLDDMSNDDFEEFADGVATVRVSAELNDDNLHFNSKEIFGELSINDLLNKILEKSVSPKAKQLLKLANKSINHAFYEPYRSEGTPIYQTYLVEKLNINIEDSAAEKWERRRQESKEIRKRMVAAYLSICHENNNIEPYYASAQMIYRISDKSIRDYLWELDKIFSIANIPLHDFVSSKIDVETQNKGIKQSSQEKMNSLPKSPINSPDKVGKLVFGLATLTRIIQTESNDDSHLRSSERGRFRLKFHSDNEEIINLVKDAADAGFMRIIEKDKDSILFRVHASLAPAFKFSYRGAYYDTPITLPQLKGLILARNNEELESEVKKLSEEIYDIGDSHYQFTIDDI